jgi:hypothetical protein
VETEERRVKGKFARDKGKRNELSLMHILRDTYGYHVRRGYVFQHESDLVGLDGIHVECKAVEKLNIHKAMEQATAEAEKRKDGIPTVFHKKSREGWLVTMKLEDWIDLYGEWAK